MVSELAAGCRGYTRRGYCRTLIGIEVKLKDGLNRNPSAAMFEPEGFWNSIKPRRPVVAGNCVPTKNAMCPIAFSGMDWTAS